MTGPHGGFLWYELLTPDPAASRRFYDPVVCWSMDEQAVAPGIDYRMITRADGGTSGGVMTLTDEMMKHGARPVWLGYLHVVDTDAAAKAILADGGTVIMPPWDQPGVGRLAMVTDPAGAAFYLMDPIPPEPQEEPAKVFSVDRPQFVRWNELATDDPDGAIDFYTRHFGWVPEGELDMGPLGKYRFVHHDGTMIGAVMPRLPDMPASAWTYYIGVDDIDRAAAAITAGGGRILQPPQEIPGGEYSLNALDPQGAGFGLVGPRR